MDGSDAAEKVELAAEGPAAPEPGTGSGRRSRRKRQVRARTGAIKQLRKDELRLGAQLYPVRDYDRPRTRAECLHTERPCPFVGCKHHLYLDVSARGGIKFNFPDLEVWELAENGALDVAERPGGVTLEEVGAIMNLTRERIRQLEALGLQRLEEAGLRDLLHEGRRRATGGRRRPCPVAEEPDEAEAEVDVAAGDE
ncbi:MAG: hypothetical protein HY907_03150 [Deltaproteobacteria bacterium]|nr:hypothetical protein [Deltaproteobacteria bacterium]